MLRYLITALCLLLLSACTASAPAPAGPLVIRDSDPVQFAGRDPSRAPVRGIDVARFQRSVNWNAARGAGVQFAFIKATEGGDLLDPMFRDHWRGAGRAGIARGAYHFYYFCTPPAVQARWFIANVPRRADSLPPVLDMEWNPLSPTCKQRPDAATIRAEMRVFLDLVGRHYGQRPIIYTTPGFFKDAGLQALQNEEFWLRSTARSPREAFPGQRWRFWQYSATGRLPATPGDIDLNVFNGGPDDWAAWRARRQQ